MTLRYLALLGSGFGSPSLHEEMRGVTNDEFAGKNLAIACEIGASNNLIGVALVRSEMCTCTDLNERTAKDLSAKMEES